MTNENAINRQATMSNAAYQIEKALAAQPQVAKDNRIQLIGSGSFGDLAVDFWGVVDRGEVDLWDVALAGTSVSMTSVITGKQWDDLQNDAQSIYDNQRSPYGVAA
ncbi:hypothetical protein FUT88_13180 [Ralstonia sp. TCR112]|uniref:hypothetical protein n=1 Tax=Ralstonia sp. TCR112 TaxID=2601730 RepID=UPI0011BEA646|nr:hypothetical protein [Ralstonia sp. TCR112]TXD58828.1 hypothetical protein FUT88_13180 [Ralstonia sp. TCR112]